MSSVAGAELTRFATAVSTKAVVAIEVVVSPTFGVGAVGFPVSCALLIGASKASAASALAVSEFTAFVVNDSTSDLAVLIALFLSNTS